MKEVLTKKFWLDVKRTFEEAKDETSAKAGSPAPSAERPPGDESPAEAPIPPRDLNNTADIEELQESRASDAPSPVQGSTQL